ncbi:DUF4347 domain-containing protein, partial [Hydrocoleum sp. CS-953]|uniref:DUF4347 domain-containing protein n=1 Tax=Hydrocoleum sp. CS-953 TaxID=1671698 RepID=UPI00117A3068
MSQVNIYQSVSTKKSIQSIDISSQLESPQQIVFIDSNIEDYQSLANGVLPGTKVVILRPTADGVQQITKVLKKYPYIPSIHIVSHGTPGCLYLGNSQLNINSINNDYCQELEAWSVTNLFLYGCNIASGNAGKGFLAQLREITGANIAASAKPTGNVALGGDWELEVIRGKLEVSLAFSDQIQSQWEHILAPFEEQPYFYQVISGQLRIFNPLTNNYESVGVAHPDGYNATGFNTLNDDNFIYGIEGGSTSKSGNVVRIHSDGTVEDLLIGGATVTVNEFPEPGDPNLNSGDVDDQGNLWVRTGDTELTRINLTTGAQVRFSLSGDGSGKSLARVADLIYNTSDQKFYGIDNNANLYVIDNFNITDAINGIGTLDIDVSTNQIVGLPTGRDYGAVWIDEDFDLYASRNNREELYRIKDFTGTSPEAILVANSEATGNNDGMSDPRQKSAFKVPFIDPDPDNVSTVDPFSYQNTFTEDTDEDNDGEIDGVSIVDGAVDIKDFDGSVDLDDDGNVDDTGGKIRSAEITLTNPQDSDELFVDEVDGITVTRDANDDVVSLTVTATGSQITITGDGTDVIIVDAGTDGASAEDFETALKAIQFRNTSDTPNTTPREIEIQLTDTDDDTEEPNNNNNTGNIAKTTIKVIPVNDPPAFTGLDPENIITEDNTVTVNPNATPVTPVVLDNGAEIKDPELFERNNYNGAVLTLQTEIDEVETASGNFSNGSSNVLGDLTDPDNPGDPDLTITVDGTTTTIGKVTENTAGKLELTFNNKATSDLVNLALRNIAYDTDYTTDNSIIRVKYTIEDNNKDTGTEADGNYVSAFGSIEVQNGNTLTVEPSAINNSTNYNGTSVIIQRDGGPNSEDEFSSINLTEDTTFDVEGTISATITVTTNSNGILQLTFSDQRNEINADVINQVLEQITYTNTGSNADPVTINYYIEQGINGPLDDTGFVTINRPPTAIDDTFSMDEDSGSVTFDLLGGTPDTTDDDDRDPDRDLNGDPDTLSIKSINGVELTGETQTIDVPNGTVNVDGDGNITFTPDENYNGSISFDYVVEDGRGGEDTGTVTGTVNSRNDLPTAVNDTATVA